MLLAHTVPSHSKAAICCTACSLQNRRHRFLAFVDPSSSQTPLKLSLSLYFSFCFSNFSHQVSEMMSHSEISGSRRISTIHKCGIGKLLCSFHVKHLQYDYSFPSQKRPVAKCVLNSVSVSRILLGRSIQKAIDTSVDKNKISQIH